MKVILFRQKQISVKHPTLTREQLRDFAREHGIKRGRNTGDTIANIKRAGFSHMITP